MWHLNGGTGTNTRMQLGHIPTNRLSFYKYATYNNNTCYSKEKTNDATAFCFLTSAFTLFHLSQLYLPQHLVFKLCNPYKSNTEVPSTLLCIPVSPDLADFYALVFQGVTA